MGKYNEVASTKTYAGPTCQVKNDNPNADGTFDCNMPAYQTINGLAMCDGHAALERIKAEGIREVQAKARAYCLSLGLDTPEKVRAHATKLAKTVFTAGASRDWAGNVLRRIEDGESLPRYVQQLAEDVAGQP